MKKALTRGEKLLFLSPLLFLVIAGVGWQRQKTAPYRLALPDSNNVYGASFSPDNGRLAIVLKHRANRKSSGYVFDLNARSKICDLEVPLPASIGNHLARPVWSDDGKRIFVKASHYSPPDFFNRIFVWDAQDGNLKVDTSYRSGESRSLDGNIRFSADGKTLLGQGANPDVLDAATGRRLFKNNKIEVPFHRQNNELGLWVMLNPKDGTQFRVIDSKTKQIVWKPAIKNARSSRWEGDTLCVYDIGPRNERKFYPNQRLLLWDGRKRRQLPSPPVPSGGEIHSYILNPDQRTIACVYRQFHREGDRVMLFWELVVWDYKANRELWRYEGLKGGGFLQTSPDGKFITVVDIDSTPPELLVFDRKGTSKLRRATASSRKYWSSDSKQLAVVISETDKVGRELNKYIEIHRFEDE